MNKWYIPLLSITFDKVKKNAKPYTHILPIRYSHPTYTLKKKKKSRTLPRHPRASLQHIPNPILHRLAPSFSLRILTIHLGVTHLQEKAKNEAEQDGDSRHGRVGCECSLHIQHQFQVSNVRKKKKGDDLRCIEERRSKGRGMVTRSGQCYFMISVSRQPLGSAKTNSLTRKELGHTPNCWW